MECGHNFCWGCLSQHWRESEETCPLGKETVHTRNLQPRRQLANVVEIVKELSRQEGKEPDTKQMEGEGRLCKKHQEPLKLFCQQDQILICMVCRTSKEHKSHEVVPLEEASQAYKDKFHASLKIVREKRAKLTAHKVDIMKESQALLEETESESQKTVAEFGKLRQFLEEQENLLLGRMAVLEEEIERERDKHLARVSHELSCLESLIRDMEEKQQQPDVDLLQDVRSTLKRYEEGQKFGDLVAFAPELKEKICDVCGINDFLEVHMMKQFKDSLASRLYLQKPTVNVTLDPDTAHPELVLSEAQKSIIWQTESQELPNNPERFDFTSYVMGYEEFSAGLSLWEETIMAISPYHPGAVPGASSSSFNYHETILDATPMAVPSGSVSGFTGGASTAPAAPSASETFQSALSRSGSLEEVYKGLAESSSQERILESDRAQTEPEESDQWEDASPGALPPMSQEYEPETQPLTSAKEKAVQTFVTAWSQERCVKSERDQTEAEESDQQEDTFWGASPQDYEPETQPLTSTEDKAIQTSAVAWSQERSIKSETAETEAEKSDQQEDAFFGASPQDYEPEPLGSTIPESPELPQPTPQTARAKAAPLGAKQLSRRESPKKKSSSTALTGTATFAGFPDPASSPPAEVTPPTKRQRTSIVWDYFTETPDKFWANCNICQKDVQIGNPTGCGRLGTASLRQHLKRHRPGLLE